MTDFDTRADAQANRLATINAYRSTRGRRPLTEQEAEERNALLRELDELNRTGGPDARPRRDEVRERLALLDDPEIRKARPKRPEDQIGTRRAQAVSVTTAPRDGKLAAAGEDREPWTPPRFPDDEIPF